MAKRGKIEIGGTSEPKESSEDRLSASADSASSAGPATETASAASTPSSSEAEDDPGSEGAQSYDAPPRRPKSERHNAFDVSAWLLEGVLGIGEELRHNDLGLSEEFWTHAYGARREALLAARALLDAAIERCERDEQEKTTRQERQKRRGQVDIDFD